MEQSISEIVEDARAALFAQQEKEYQYFNTKLIPNIAPELIIGVKRPLIRKMAKEMRRMGTAEKFMDALPHKYVEEYVLHNSIIEDIKDFEEAIRRVEALVPYLDNWATTDTLAPKAFKKNTAALYPHIVAWIESGEEYVVRVGVIMLMKYYLGEAFRREHLDLVASVRHESYYTRMGVAWYFATALASQWEETLPYIEGHRLEKWTHNKAIQKARESLRVPTERKEYLNGLKLK